MLLEGKVAVVSGAGAGLGRAVCVALARHGARVVIGDINPEAVAASLAAVGTAAGQAIGQPTDITNREECEALVSSAVETYGGVDIVVNDAYDGGDFALFAHADLRRWRRVSEVNVFGSLNLTQAALPALTAAGSSSVVMVCTHGVEVIQPSFGAYTTSKAALAHATKLLAAELGGGGVRVNAVFPGPMWGSGLQGYLDGLSRQRGVEAQVVYDEWLARNALKRFVTTDDVADCIVFLASDMARAVTGQGLYVNAGESFH